MLTGGQREVAGTIRSQADLCREMIYPDLAERKHFEVLDSFDVKIFPPVLQIWRVDEQVGLCTLQRQITVASILNGNDLPNF